MKDLPIRIMGGQATDPLADSRADYTSEQIKQVKEELHAIMDQHLDRSAQKLQQDLDQGDSSSFLQTWSTIFEEAVMQQCQIDEEIRRSTEGMAKCSVNEKTYPSQANFLPLRMRWSPVVQIRRLNELASSVVDYKG